MLGCFLVEDGGERFNGGTGERERERENEKREEEEEELGKKLNSWISFHLLGVGEEGGNRNDKRHDASILPLLGTLLLALETKWAPENAGTRSRVLKWAIQMGGA